MADKNKQDDEALKELKDLAEAQLPPSANVGFDNEGNMVVRNRAYRRRNVKLPGDNLFTKKKVTKAKRKKLRKLGRR